MAFRFKDEESVAHGIRRLARKSIRGAIDGFEHGGSTARTDAIHEGRTSIKKARALLELLRGDLGHTYARDSRQLRKAARLLSQRRDATVVLDTFDDLRRRHPAALRSHRWREARRTLTKASAAMSRGALSRDAIAGTLERLAAVDHDSRSWSPGAHGFRGLRPGLTRGFARARKAWRRVRADQPSDRFHEWRKRLKTHWYQTRLLESADRRRLGPYLTKLRRLERWLGVHHDLAVLGEELRRQQPQAARTQDDVEHVCALIERQQAILERKAIALGGVVYRERPQVFVTRMEALWTRWRARTQRD